MTPGNFQKQNEERWQELERILALMDSNAAPPEEVNKLPGLFRQACSDLSLAQHRMYGLRIIDRINRLVVRGYRHMYKETGNFWGRLLRFLSTGLPRLVRREWNLFVICNLTFWVPFLALMKSAEVDPRWVQATLGPEGMANMEQMWGEGTKLEDVRDGFGSNFMMFGFYVWNNIGIDFKIFVGGSLACLGTLFYLLFNGFYLGAAFGYVNEVGASENFYLFVVGHSSVEFLGMILAGMAGLRLGLAILSPGRKKRSVALVDAGKIAIRLLAGAFVMTFLAALVEGFWSPNDFEPATKYWFGGTLWVGCYLYLLLAGRTWGAEQRQDYGRRIVWLAGIGAFSFVTVVALEKFAGVNLIQLLLWSYVIICGTVLLQERGKKVHEA